MRFPILERNRDQKAARFLTSGLAVFLLLATFGCKSIQIDPSTNALASGDLTLFVGASNALPGQGGDIYRVAEGSAISGTILLVLPNRANVTSGEISVMKADGTEKPYSWTGASIEIPWTDQFDHPIFEHGDGQLLKVTGTVTWSDLSGHGGLTSVEGLILLVVLAPGYNPMPIDSGVNAWQTSCTYQFSTAGRTAVSCK